MDSSWIFWKIYMIRETKLLSKTKKLNGANNIFLRSSSKAKKFEHEVVCFLIPKSIQWLQSSTMILELGIYISRLEEMHQEHDGCNSLNTPRYATYTNLNHASIPIFVSIFTQQKRRRYQLISVIRNMRLGLQVSP